MRFLLTGITLLVVVLCGCATEADVEEWEQMQLIDGPKATAVMKVAAATVTPGWFDDTTPGAVTDFDADWGNAVQGELTNLITGLGGTLDKALVNQLATLIVPLLTIDGRFRDSLYAVLLDSADYGVKTLPVFGAPVLPIASRLSAFGFVAAADYKIGSDTIIGPDKDATLRDIGGRDVDFTGTSTLRGKVKNAAAADVVFDDGVTVEGKHTAQGGLRTVEGTDTASFVSGHDWEAECNTVGGKITIPFDSTNYVDAALAACKHIIVTCDKCQATSRVILSLEYAVASTFPKMPSVAVVPSNGSFTIHIVNHGTSNIEDAVIVGFDVINPV